MVTDKNGKELKVGDEIIVRGKIVAIVDLEDEGKGLLQMKWDTAAIPLIDYAESKEVAKAE